ncbi:MAG TPA: hypothetical protein DCQ77_10105 [Betaproteobacteria bacterium]|nr:hypothetical protein [Betaproteobacteria bacterium]
MTALQHLLHPDNYQIMTAFSAEEALEVLAQHGVDVMVTGLTLPGMTGIELLRRAMKMHPDVVRIVLSSAVERQHVADDNDRKDLIHKTLIQPWDDQHLRSQLDDAFRHKALADANQRHSLEFHREYKAEIQRLNLKTKALDQTLASANLKLERALDQQQHQAMRANTQLDIMREMLEHIPLPMIGMDDDGVIVFLNMTAETLFAAEGLTIGQDARALLPAFYDAIDNMGVDHTLPVQINCQDYRVTCQRMGEHSLSRGNLLTLVKQEENA